MHKCTLSFRDENIPKKRSAHKTLKGAESMIYAWFNTYAGVESAHIDNQEGRHIYTPSQGYLLTIPMEALNV